MHYLLTIIIVLLFSYLPLSAQWAPKAEHLWEIGRRDSIYSQVLDEVRDFWVHLPTNYELSEGNGKRSTRELPGNPSSRINPLTP